jgi:hypothetical protein
MRTHYTIAPDVHLVTLTSGESPPVEEFRCALDAVLADPDFRPGFNFLSDRRSVRATPTATDIERVGQEVLFRGHELGGGLWAIVVADLSSYGVARMKSMLLDESGTQSGITLAVFTDIDEARRWLGDGASLPDRGADAGAGLEAGEVISAKTR